MQVAYADPPYMGVAHRYPEKTEVDHQALLSQLATFDGWALSASSPSLFALLPMCPKGTRIGAWGKTWVRGMPNVRPTYAWEPVLFSPARRVARDLVRDWHLSQPAATQRVLGQKPLDFSMWVFRLMGALPGDELVDLFPGSGGVARAWDEYASRPDPLPLFSERGDEVGAARG